MYMSMVEISALMSEVPVCMGEGVGAMPALTYTPDSMYTINFLYIIWP